MVMPMEHGNLIGLLWYYIPKADNLQWQVLVQVLPQTEEQLQNVPQMEDTAYIQA